MPTDCRDTTWCLETEERAEERACPQKRESLPSSSTPGCLLTAPGFTCRLKTALMTNAPRLRVLAWRLKRLGDIQTKFDLFVSFISS